MREILFRGKDKKTGDWISGDLSQTAHKVFIDNDDCCVRVDPETVGQYTNILDNIQNKIFEGDILNFYNDINGNSWLCTCVFIDGCFAARYTDGTYNDFNAWHSAVSWVVIGNVYDNAELWEAEK